MALDRQQYNAVVRWISRQELPLSPRDLNFQDIHPDTLGSIACHEYVKHTKNIIYRHNKPHIIAGYHVQFKEALAAGERLGVLLRMATRLQLSPALLAKFVLNCHANATDAEYRLLCDARKRRRLAAMVRRPELTLADRRVAAEVQLCTLRDTGYGPLAELVKQTIGEEYELRLKRQLRRLGIPFLDERELRRRGHDKTPDVLLDVPIAVNGCVVNWIESKASFGDDESHEQCMSEQYEKYWHRYGPGLVIYWFGYISDLLPAASARHVLLQHRLPERAITFMRPLLTVTRLVAGEQRRTEQPTAAVARVRDVVQHDSVSVLVPATLSLSSDEDA